ncbi:hypothetical protein Slala04_39520 [Streptomyces lavendulae subsp. lavendulae]|nr:hypothetical protein Slala04_39520 [Streptomyces lavendulae subsp. lavendulae]
MVGVFARAEVRQALTTQHEPHHVRREPLGAYDNGGADSAAASFCHGIP